jgi:uncharacterized protein (UPF0333 family)
MKKTSRTKGFSTVEGLLILIIVLILGGVGWYVWHSTKNANDILKSVDESSNSTQAETHTQAVGNYKGWKIATSTRAKFSIKYPSDWNYSSSIGSKDNTEHIVIDGKTFHITIDSFGNNDNSIPSDNKCIDCQTSNTSSNFKAGASGSLNLEDIKYKLDDGVGNALILRRADGAYFINSPTSMGVKTTFRGISKLASLQDYQKETAAQFALNPDLATAKLILKSVSY